MISKRQSFILSLIKLQNFLFVSKDNNFFGIHILFPEELDKAAILVNSNGGDWGYVTIPIQSGDKNIEKWQKFMDKASDLHLIPILRLSTEGDPKNTSVWRKPNNYDIVDFANFLSSLAWPTENRYVIFFNEINRYDEWGGDKPDPKYYTDLLDFAVDVFKSRNNDFFIIMGGLDLAAPSDGVKFLNGYEFLNQMASNNPEIFNKIDGFASHSYPNPNFSSPPDSVGNISVSSYKHEYEFINKYTKVKKPVFITETGWNLNTIGEEKIASYFTYTFEKIWSPDKDKIVAVTPFLLESQNGQFDKFSFLKQGVPTSYFRAVQAFKKVKGDPNLSPKISITPPQQKVLGVMDFRDRSQNLGTGVVGSIIKLYLERIFSI